MKRIGTKIILIIANCSFIMALLVGISAVLVSTDYIDREAKDKIQYIASTRGNEFEAFTNKIETTVSDVADVMLVNLNTTQVKNDYYMGRFVEDNAATIMKLGSGKQEIIGLYINFDPSFTSGRQGYDIAYIYDSEAKEPTVELNGYTLEEYDSANEDLDWYYDPIQAGKGVWSAPYVDSVSNVNMISYTMPVYLGDQLVGVAGADISFEYLRDLILNTKVYETGYAFMLGSDLTYLIDKEVTDGETRLDIAENGSYQSLANDITSNKEGISELTYMGKKALVGYYTLENGLIVGIVAPMSEVNLSAYRIINLMIIVGFAGVVLSVLIGFSMSRRITGPVEQVTKIVMQASEFDFTQDVPKKYLKSKDEIGVLARSMNTMQSAMREIMHGLVDEAAKVDQAASSTQQEINVLREAIDDVSATTEELSAAMEETSASALMIETSSKELDRAVEGIAVRATEGAEAATEISKRAEQLKENAIASRKSAQETHNEIDARMEEAILQARDIEKIGVISESILQITAQTNLLSLNASIEASRAGEAGHGFAIVANEIRKLAEDSKEAVTQIQAVTNQVISSVSNLSDSSKQVLDFIENQVIKDYDSMVVIGEQYYDDADYIQKLVTEFDGASKELATSIHNMINSINEISNANNEETVGVQSIAEKTSEIAYKANEVVKISHMAKETSEKIMNIIRKFQV